MECNDKDFFVLSKKSFVANNLLPLNTAIDYKLCCFATAQKMEFRFRETPIFPHSISTPHITFCAEMLHQELQAIQELPVRELR